MHQRRGGQLVAGDKLFDIEPRYGAIHLIPLAAQNPGSHQLIAS